MSLIVNSKRFFFVTGALLGLAFSCLNAAAQPLVQPVTLTYDGLGVGNDVPIPDPYPGLTPATVTHSGVEGGAIHLSFQDTYFWGGIAVGNRYGDLLNVALGPRGTPSAFGLEDPAYGVIRITPNYPGTFVRVLSLDIAKFAGLAAVETSDAFVLDSEIGFYGGTFGFEVSGADSASHTHVDFGALEGPPDRPMMIWWKANNGRLAVDNIMFEIVGPAPELLARNDFYSVAQGGNLALAAPGVMGNDLLRTATGPLTASLLVGATKGTLNLAGNGGFSYTSTSSAGMDGFAYRASDTAAHISTGVALISVLPAGALFYDDFARPAGYPVLTPWVVRNGTWTIATGVLSGVAAASGHGDVYVNNNWTDYSVDVTASVAADGYGWAVGGRLNPDIGSLYEVFLYANTAPGAQWKLHLTKHSLWTWDGATFAPDVDVPVVAGSPESTGPHTIRMSFQGNRVTVFFDGIQYMDVTDTDPTALAMSSGGIKVGMYSLNNAVFRVEDVTVRQLGDATPPTITSATAVNGTTVQVLFSEPVALASAQTLANYSINNGVTISAAVLGADTRTVTLTTSTLATGNYILTVNNVTDRATVPNPIAPNSQSPFSFTADTTRPTITSVTAVNATTVQVLFSEPVALTSAQTLANYGINNGVTISAAVLGADTRTVTLTTSALAGGNYTLTVNNVTDRATPANPILPNTQAGFSFNPADTTRPTITSVTAVNATTVQVLFSEPVALASAQTLANYGINNGVTISAAVLGADTRTVTLTTSTLVTGNYILTVNNVTDRATVPNPILPNTQAAFSFNPADTTRPTITSVTAVNATTVQVLFSEPVALASAQTLANYGINNGVTISAAVLGGDTRTVTLTTSTLVTGNYILTVNNVTDRATVPNPILPNTQAAFSFGTAPSSPVFTTAASAVDVDGNASASLTFAQGALTDGYVVVGVSMWSPVVAASITGVTYDGTAMTLLGTIQDADAYSEAYLFGLAVGNKAAGNYNVALTGSTGITQLAFGVSAFSGVSQTAPTGPVATTTGSSTTASVAVTSATGDVVVDIISQDDGTSTLGAGQTQNWRQEDATDRADGVSSRETATGATTTMSYTESAASSWSLAAVALKGSGPPPPDVTRPTITSVTAVNATTVQVLFSEPVALASAQTLGNYSINNGVTISAAVLGGDTRTVTLTTSTLVAGNYILTVNNVTDLATVPNPILPGSQAAFSFALSPVFNTAASAVDVDGNASASLTFAQGALTDGYVVVGVSMWDPVVAASITGVTYGGTAMTLLGTIQDANAYSEAYLFGLAVGNKAAGNYSVALTGSTGIDQLVFGVSAFSGVSQTAPTGPVATTTGSSTTASVAVTSATGDVVVDIISQDDGTSTLGAGQTQNWRQEDATDRADGVSSRETATGATTTMSYTESAASSWSLAAVALKGSGPPPPDVTRPTITSVTAVNATTVQVLFSEPVALASAQTLGNYSINNGVTISAAVLGGDTRTVTLTTSALVTGNYLLTVNNVTDRATVPNPILPNTQAAFNFTADTTRPTITSVTVVNATTVQVLFSEPVALASAQTLGNYSINNGVTISAAVLGGDTRTVTLTTSTLVAGNYLLTVNNVTDVATVPNPILPNTQAAFSFALSPVFSTATSAVDVDGNASASLTFAQGALTKGYIVVGVSMWSPLVGASVTGVTYDGTAMTLLGTIQDANAYSEVYLFGLAVGNKAAGNYNLALTGSTGIPQLVFGVSAFSGVNQTTPTGPFASATGSSTTASVAVSSVTGDVVVDIISQDDGTSTLGAGQTQNWRQEDATDRADGVSSRETATGATTTMSYLESVASSWSIGAVALKP